MSITLNRSVQKQQNNVRTFTLSFAVEANTTTVLLVATRSAFTTPAGYTLVYTETVPNYSSQYLHFLVKKNETATTESVTLTQASSGRMYSIAFVLSGVERASHEAGYNNNLTTSSSLSVTLTKPSAHAACIWGLSTAYASGSSDGIYEINPSNDVTMVTSDSDYHNQIRLVGIFDDGTGAQSHTVTNAYNNSRGYAIDAIVLHPILPTQYLIEDGGQLYTVENGALVAISGTFNAELFELEGFDSLTGVGALLETLTAPTVYAWRDSEQPTLLASVEAVPYPQNIETASVNLVTNEITSVDEINISYTGAPLFAVNIDGEGWIMYNGSAWVSAGDTGGMTVATLTGITEQQWNDLFTAATTLKVRATLTDENDTISEFQMIFLTL